MKPVPFRTSQKLPISRILAAFFLVIVLASCGANTAATSAPAGPKPSSATNALADASSALKLNKANISVDVGRLRIQSRLGFQCPGIGTSSVSVSIGQLVLASDRTTSRQN